MQDKSKTEEVDYTFSLDTKLFDRQTARSHQLLSSEFYSQEEIKTLLDAYIHSQRNVWANSIVG